MKVTCREAGKLVGQHRGNIYKLINKGVLRGSRDARGKLYVETADLLRLFAHASKDIASAIFELSHSVVEEQDASVEIATTGDRQESEAEKIAGIVIAINGLTAEIAELKANMSLSRPVLPLWERVRKVFHPWS